MDTIYANRSISMSEFKKNPAQVLREAGTNPSRCSTTVVSPWQ